jgi:phospholipid/cholesterol/gamma-HCH transport system permease protein
MNPVKKFLLELQETAELFFTTVWELRKAPRYPAEIVHQMDLIGVGSLPIILLTGFFTGGVLVLQGYQTLAYYGGQSETGRLVAATLIRELGPVLTALMVAGRVGSAISAELGSMVVSQQIDAMRALGTDPLRKLVAPRLIALLVTLPLLTVAADIVGLIGGGFVGQTLFNLSQNVYINSVRNGIVVEDVIGGVIKPVFFALIIGLVSCYKGLSTEGGTVGVGRSTTSAVVVSSIVIIIADFFLSRALQTLLGVY